MWAAIFLSAAAVFAACVVFLIFRLSRVFTESGVKRLLSYIFSAAALLIVFAALFLVFGFIGSAVILIYLVLILLLTDGVSFFLKKYVPSHRKTVSFSLAAILTAILFVFSYFNAVNVERTYYSVPAEKSLSDPFRIAGFSDSHIGATFSGKELEEYVLRINSENPDAVVIVGDFIDDSTTLQDMKDACRALSLLTPKYGTYFVFGNHDSGLGLYSRGYGKNELVAELEKNGVTVLEDTAVSPAPGINIIGRLDRSAKNRLPINELVRDTSVFNIVLDHQPGDYDAEAESGADLVISGHTHGGQFFPINRLGELIKANDKTYGFETRKNTSFIVSSGISSWQLTFKSGCFSEYFVIDIKCE